MSALHQTETFPRPALIGVGVMLAVTLVGAGAARLSHLHAPASVAAEPPPVAQAELRFADAADGAIRVTDARTGAEVADVAPGTGGFVRGVLRGLARDRISRHIGSTPPFRLARMADGRLTLTDLATGRAIDLEAFGSDNRGAFLSLLNAAGRRA